MFALLCWIQILFWQKTEGSNEIIEWEKLILIEMITHCVNVDPLGVDVPEGFIPILVHVSF